MVAALDLYSLFVQYVFGNFAIAVLALMLLMFIILGVLGRVSIYTTTWICLMFLLCMCIGYGFVTLNIIITLAILLAFLFSMRNYFG